MKKPIVLIFLQFLLSSSIGGSEFRYLRTSEGLSDGEITSIAQDSSGNMWFATYTGLTKYDGCSFELFRPELDNPKSLPDIKIKKLFVDSANNLWIVSARTLSVYNKGRNNFHQIIFERDTDSELNILYLSELSGHLVIHAVEGFFLLPFDQAFNPDYRVKKRIFTMSGDTINHYFRFSKSMNQKLFLVKKYTGEPSMLYFATLSNTRNDTTLELTFLSQINSQVNSAEYLPSEKTVYLATNHGLATYSLVTNGFIKGNYFSGVDLQNLIYTSTHTIFCSAKGPELLELDIHTGHTRSFLPDPNKTGTLLNNNILSLYEDFSGNLWIGHQGQGLSILNLYRKNFKTFRRDPLNQNTLISNTVMCFEESENEILIGCRVGGLNILKKEDLTKNSPVYIHIEIPSEENGSDSGIWDMEKECDSLYWLATDAGLFKLTHRDNKFRMEKFGGNPEISEVILSLYMDENKNLWCGTYEKGLIFIPFFRRNTDKTYFRYNTDSENHNSLSDNCVKALFIDSNNRFWIGTANGLNCLKSSYNNLDLSGLTKPELLFERFSAKARNKSFLNNIEVNGFSENFDGNLWIATYGGGINILNPETGTFSYITEGEGLPSNDVFGMLPDESGNLWISTTRGLASLNRYQNSPVDKYARTDGIQGDVFMVNSYFKTNDGAMFFGGDNGFTFFYPQKIKVNAIKPKVEFTKLRIRNRVYEVGDTLYGKVLESTLAGMERLVLPYDVGYFGIGISALHFQNPEKNTISYTLEGYYSGWATLPASNQYVMFSNLPYGEYVLKTKAVSSDNVSSANIRTLVIEIKPPWYRTWYMNAVFIILIISALTGLIYIIVNRQRLIYQKRLDALALENNEKKMMFLTNIAHELRTPLSLVVAPIEHIIQNYSNENRALRNHLQLIQRNANYLMRLINQIIDFRKLNAGKLKLQLKKTDVVRLVKDVVLNFKGYQSNRNVNLILKVPSEAVMVPVDAQKIEEVLYNLISNAYKYTPDNHGITVSLQIVQHEPGENGDSETIRISVYNDGKEISEEDKSRIFDRFYKVDENSDGAGIGLSFAKSLVEMHKGTIEIESIRNKGVVFHVNLPIKNVEMVDNNTEDEELQVQVPAKETVEAPKISPDAKPGPVQKVVVVEDNDDLGSFLLSVLSGKYQCFRAVNGKAGLQLVAVNKPDVVITDIIMPEMDGFELCSRLKESRETCHIPVIMLTAKNAGDQIERGFQVGADAYVTKPFDINLLLSQVERLIQNRELIREKYRTQNYMVEVNSQLPKDEEFLNNVHKLLENNYSDPEFNVNVLSQRLNISTTQLYRKLKALTGYSPVEFIRIIKLQNAFTLLNQRNKTVKEVCYLTGFNNLSYFIKCFKDQFGVTPANFRDKGLMPEDKTNIDTNLTQVTNIGK